MNTLRYTLLPMLAAMAAAVAVMMLVSRPLERTIGTYPGIAVSVFLSCAVYIFAARLLGLKPKGS